MKQIFTFFCLGLFLHIAPTFAQTFSEVSLQSGIHFVHKHSAIMGGGAVFFDYDNDGKEDLFLTGGNAKSRLYKNNGNGTFTDKTTAAGLVTADSTYVMGAVAGDIDNDGDKDLFITTWGKYFFYTDKANILYKNNGNGTFTDISTQAGITQKKWSTSATFGDYNLDGYLDIYVANYIDTAKAVFSSPGVISGYAHVPQPDFLYLNNHNNTFTEVAGSKGIADIGIGLGAAFTDFDFDHDVDIYLCNDFGQWLKSSTMYRNNYPQANFTDIGGAGSINSHFFGMGVAIGDYDEDGDLDYYETNIGKNNLYRNEGGGAFTDVSVATGTDDSWVSPNRTATGWGTFFADFDNDSKLDLYVSNGYMESGDSATVPISANHNPNALFKNNGNGTFSNIAVAAGVTGGYLARGAAMSDYDNDGDMDIVSSVLNYFPVPADTVGNSPRILLFKNNLSNANKWLKVKLVGVYANKDGYGSRITVFMGNRKLIREVDGGSSHCSHNTTLAHFGLGNVSKIDSLHVDWIGGHHQSILNPALNQLLTVTESAINAIDASSSVLSSFSVYPNPAQSQFFSHFDLKQSITGAILVQDIVGHTLSLSDTQFFPEGFHTVEGNIEGLAKGLYYVSLVANGQIVQTKPLLVD